MHTSRARSSQGFTIAETLICLIILLLLLTFGFMTFGRARKNKTLDTVADGVNFTLDQARTAALTGRDNNSFGIYFTSSSFILFDGTSYNALSKNNKITNLPSGWSLSTSTGLTNNSLYFQRLTGVPSATNTITVYRTDEPTLSRQITIGSDGAISVIK